ncbi:FecR family protein [Pseudoalteromonas carrageenovora]|uniref:FecR family protein n=1 Tax=Pseudoalteromonas carrageenovora TaxID=227 RepID=UPI0026E3E4BD|nr:FecR family protein [Pseudoalteromonas carrageenovora]MDO6463686.1 FecR family protein [Pseudoalteromonas carrageenovora]MDO6548931.1 FecR family protein [Pseudoalteromonas carrageenovora]MDO6833436.1 FecR family protein [Pseudoalteromonas carrageenovora]
MKHLTPVLTTLLCVSFYSQANTTAAGKTILARGAVVATDATSEQQRSLKRRDTVYGVDKITTGEKSKAQFSMSDGGLIALKENSVLNIANYEFDAGTQQGSASIELIKGGLRSISGVIKKNGGSYNVKTPVGSIGIRGTHFELQLVDGDMYVAVWDGAIDLTLQDNSILSLGSNEAFSFAQVTSVGDVIKTTQAPAIFTQSIASINSNDESEAEQDQIAENSASENNEDADTLLADVYAEQQFQAVSNAALIDQIAQRQGIFNYQATSFDVSSSLGEVSDFSMSMSVDFDNGTVPDGEISFNDAGGNWYAAYSGFIDLTKLDLAVTFASHNNNKAVGDIDAIFLNDIDTITGDFNLNEISNPAVNSSGSFRLEP